jgi:hypothetical protein
VDVQSQPQRHRLSGALIECLRVEPLPGVRLDHDPSGGRVGVRAAKQRRVDVLAKGVVVAPACE